jgi:hypothetical protein
MICPSCHSDSLFTLASQASGTVTVRRRQCKACDAQWLSKVTEEIIQGTIVLAKPAQPCAGLSTPVQEPSSGQPSDLRSESGSGPPDPSKQDPGKSELDEPPAPALLTFPVSGKAKTWDLTAKTLGPLREAFPALDVMSECRKALAWLKVNPRRQKTHGGMPAFLFNWMGKTQNRWPGQLPLAAPASADGRQPYKPTPFVPREEWPGKERP